MIDAKCVGRNKLPKVGEYCVDWAARIRGRLIEPFAHLFGRGRQADGLFRE